MEADWRTNKCCNKIPFVWIPHYKTVSDINKFSSINNRLINYWKRIQTDGGPSSAQLLLIIMPSHYGKCGDCNVYLWFSPTEVSSESFSPSTSCFFSSGLVSPFIVLSGNSRAVRAADRQRNNALTHGRWVVASHAELRTWLRKTRIFHPFSMLCLTEFFFFPGQTSSCWSRHSSFDKATDFTFNKILQDFYL